MPTSKSKSPSEFEQQVAASSSSMQEFKLATPPSTGTGVASARATAVASPLSYYTSSQLSSMLASKSCSRSSQRRRPRRIGGDGKDSSSTSESKPSCTQKTTGPSRVYGITEGDANERVNSFKFDFAVEPSNQTNNGFDVSLFESSNDVSNKASKRSRKKRKKKARKDYGKETADSASKVDSDTFAGTQNEMQQQTLEETGERSSHPIRNRSMGEATAPPLISLNNSTQQQVNSASKNNPFMFDPVVKQRRAMVNRHSMELHHARQQRAMVIGSHKRNDQEHNDSGVNPFTFGFSIFGNGLLP
ncbi:predicted protein [Thalassiosira pseudonana CCMP1335]|uniref:Uncharacterized protein n=1 Tax=Thalassiosira pseudonana TaxID=35128 RepID=B8LCL4_THAPS|nr:predicted protein [Thalassiosira pseudonana CCMP1335]EED86919.1 predicted protein [Thalassiosira pseudonana CCMP1335]|eukprot:scaffold1211_cov195-Alexandrium_tamarense.AAC.15